MVDFGIKPGDHVGFCAPNSYSWLIFYFGTLKAGAVVVTFSYLLKSDEFSKILTDMREVVREWKERTGKLLKRELRKMYS